MCKHTQPASVPRPRIGASISQLSLFITAWPKRKRKETVAEGERREEAAKKTCAMIQMSGEEKCDLQPT